MKLVFASNNAHKLAEVRAIMPAGVDVLSLRDIGFEQEIEETGVTLEENSMIKARTVADFINGGMSASLNGVDGVFADDTGLEIDALNGEPGVYTARWYLMDEGAQEAKTDLENFARNRAKALRELKNKDNRGCQFRTVITLICGEETIQVEGIVRGRMATEEYGEGGFGYDPIFIPEGYDKTFGELPAELKNTISHRARALAELVRVLHD
jgi:XTP/dITP diphosphohydrolase